MLSEMTFPQLRMWLEYFNLEPFGEERADLRAGIVAAVVANSNRAPNSKPFSPTDFMPKFGQGDGTSVSSRNKPLTDPKEWRKVLSRVKEAYQ